MTKRPGLFDYVLLASWTFLYAALLIVFRILKFWERPAAQPRDNKLS